MPSEANYHQVVIRQFVGLSIPVKRFDYFPRRPNPRLVGAVRINIIMIGLELIAAKEECEHGDWLPWLKENFGWGMQPLVIS